MLMKRDQKMIITNIYKMSNMCPIRRVFQTSAHCDLLTILLLKHCNSVSLEMRTLKHREVKPLALGTQLISNRHNAQVPKETVAPRHLPL